VLIVGEAPGPSENRVGRVFVGKAGERLDAWLQQAGLHQRAWITNVIRCFPGYVQRPGQQIKHIAKPPQDAILRCHEQLWEDLVRIKPKVIVAVGETAIHYFTGLKAVHTARERNFTLDWQHVLSLEPGNAYLMQVGPQVPAVPVLATYHPAATLYGQDEKKKQQYASIALADLIRARELADGGAAEMHYTMIEPGYRGTEVLSELVDTLREQFLFGTVGYVVIDIEGLGLGLEDRMVGFGLSWGPGKAVFVPWDHAAIPGCSPAWRDTVRSLMNKLLTDVPVSNQNLKFDLKILCLAGIEVRHIQHDTLLSSYWLDGDTTPHDLESLAAIHLRQFAHKHEMKAALRKLKGYAQLEQVPVQTLVDYACGDADKTWQLTGVMERRLVEQGTLPGYRALVLDQILPMSDMELRGVRVDRTVLDASLLTFRRALDDFEIWFNSTPLAAMFAAHLEQRGLVTKKRPAKFRPAASGDLRFLLYEVLQIPPHEDAIKTRQTKDGGEETSYSAAAKYREHALLYCIARTRDGSPNQDIWQAAVEFLGRYGEYAHENQIYKMYLKPLPGHIGSDGCVHTTYWIGCTASGRTAASEPSLHTLPAKYGVKDAFVPDAPLGLILSVDQSQCELRVLACLSGDQYLLASFASGADIHRMTAARLFHVAPEIVTKEQRRITKTVVFGLIYGRSAYAIAIVLQITESEAQSLIDSIFTEFPGIRTYIDLMTAFLRKHGYVYNLSTGRRRPVPTVYSDNKKEAAKAARIAVNSPVQGTASDITADAIIHMWREMQTAELKSYLFGFIHDSVLSSVAPDELLYAAKLAIREMQIMPPIRWPWIVCPLKADPEVGVSWGKLVPAEFDFPNLTMTLTGPAEKVDAVCAVVSAWETFRQVQTAALPDGSLCAQVQFTSM